MVFESFVVSLLNNYLGKYVKDLDASNLDLGIWSGNAVLNDLTLKDDALADLDLPVEVKSGFIGKLSLAIPWANLYTKPVVVEIEDVFVVATPVIEYDYDANKAEERLRAVKRRKLDFIEKSAKHGNGGTKKDTQLPSDDYTFVEKLTAQIIKNVQVFIKNIHIRYEDKVTNPASPFAVGITLKHLTAETTDEFWNPCIVEATVKKVFKFVSLDSLSVYWNTNIDSDQFYGRSAEWKSLLRSTIKSKHDKDEHYEYVLEPFSIEAQVKIDQTSAVKVNEPKVTIKVVERDMILGLSRTQFHNLMDLIESFEMMLANEPYRKYRPGVPLKQKAKVWWNYACMAIVQEKIRTWSWRNIRRHRALYHDYKNLFKIKLDYINKGVDNSPVWSRIRELEDQLDLSSILIAREHAQAEFKLNPGNLDEIEENTGGWWSWIFGGNENKKQVEDDSLSLSSLSPTEKQRLYDALDYSETSEKTYYPREYVKYVLYISMENFELRLLNEIRRTLAYVSMRDVSCSVQHRPSSSNTCVTVEVNDMNLYGHSSNLDEPQPHILALQKSDKDIDMVLFEFIFELNPIHLSADYSVLLNLEPVKIVHDTNTVMQIVNFFKMPRSRALQELTEVASSSLHELQHRTRVALEYAVSRQTIIYFDVSLRSPCIVVPEYGAMTRSGTVFVVDFGHLTIKTDLDSKKTVIQGATESELENMLCDNFDVRLSEMQILVADKAVDWETAHAQSTSPYHLLPASEIDMKIVRNTNAVRSSLPEIKLKGVLPLLDIKLSEKKYQQLMQFISNLPLLTEALDVDVQDGILLNVYPQTLSRHSSRLSLEEVTSIQTACREALSVSSESRDHDEFQDAVEEPENHEDTEQWFLASDKLPDPSSKSDAESVSSSRPVENTRSDQVTLSGKFSIEKVSIIFDKFVESVNQPYINLVISDLRAQVSLLEWEMEIRANLGSVHLIDYLFKDIHGGPLTILSSVADEDLISFSYRKVDPKCGDPIIPCDGVQYIVNTDFNSLNILLHHEGIITFQNFILDLIERSEKPNLRKLGERVSSYLEVIPEEEPLEIINTAQQEKEIIVDDSEKTKIEATLGEVLVTLSANDRYFALLKTNGLRLDALLERRRTHIKSSLEHFEIEDLDQDTLYNKILTVEDDNLCDVEMIFYSSTEIPRSPLDFDMEVLLHFGRLKFVFLHNFVTSLQNFFTSFASAETRRYAQEATNQAVQIQVENLRETSPKIGFNVDINAPLIKIPVGCRSKHGIVVNLGCLQIRNTVQYHMENSHVLTDEMRLHLDSFQVTRSNSAPSWMGSHNLINPTGLDITLTRCLEDFCTEIPATDVEAVLGQITVSIDKNDFRLLMKTWTKNIQQTVMVGTDGVVDMEDDISAMPEVEQHQIEATDGTQNNNNENTKIRLKAVVDKVSLWFPELIENKRVPYLELNIHMLKTEVVFVGSTCDGSASLGGLFLLDHRNTGYSSEFLPVLESSRDEDLISVRYSKEISDYQSTSSSQTLEILSTVIKLQLEEKSILGIQELVTSFLESSKLSSSRLSLNNPNENKASQAKLNKMETEEEARRAGCFKLIVNLTKLDLTLYRKSIKIVQAVIEDVSTEILASDDKFVVYSRQKGLSVKDPNPLSNYPDVIAIEGNKLFDFEYQSLPNNQVQLPSDSKESLSTTAHSLLSLAIGKIRFVFLYKLIADIQGFWEALVSPETTSYSYELAQKTVQDQLQIIESQGLRIALKVDIEAPIVVFPSHSQSVDCLIADLGKLHAENKFSTRSPSHDPTQTVVVDNIDVALQSVQLSRGTLDKDSRKISRRLMIQPVKITMVVSRSMLANAHWLPYLDIQMKLDHVEMNMDETDYQLLTCAMQQNFAEASVVANDSSGNGVSYTTFADAPVRPGERSESVESSAEEETTAEAWDEMVIDFTFSGLSLTLYNNEDITKLSSSSEKHHNVLASLCSCELQESSGTLVRRNNTSLNLNLLLYGCIIEDTRPSTMTAFPRMLSHSTEQEHGRKKRRSRNSKMLRPSMIEVLYEQTPTGDMKVKLTLQDPTLYVSFPLLWSLMDFFTVSPVEETTFSEPSTPLDQSKKQDIQSSASQPYSLEVKGTLKNPEIVLLGEPENPNSSALIVQTNIHFVYNLVNDRQTFFTASKGLVVHSCRYPEREKTLYKVVKPCAIDFRYSYPGSDCEGQEVDLEVPEMKVKVSPLLPKTLLDISNSFYGEQEAKEDSMSEQLTKVDNNNELWKPQLINKEDWFNRTSLERVPSRIRLNTTVTEKFSLKVKSVRITLYNEVMCHRIPLLLVNASIVSHVRDWSSELKLETDLSIEAWYHNESLAAWEPLMESEETLNGRRHWQLQLKVFHADSHVLSLPDCETQKCHDREDFISLTSSPVFADTSRELTSMELFPRYYGTERDDLDNIGDRMSPPLSLEESRDSRQKNGVAIEIDEVDAVFPYPRSPVSSDSKMDQLREIPQATYIVLSSYDIMQLTVTQSAVDVLSDVVKVFTDVTSATSCETTLPESPFVIANELGIHVSVSVSDRHESIQKSTADITITERKRIDISDAIDGGGTRHQSLGEPRNRENKVLVLTRSQIKDDSVLPIEHQHFGCSENDSDFATVRADDNDDSPKSPVGKKFVRSVSMPAKGMRSMIELAEEKERALRKLKNTDEEAVDPGNKGTPEDSSVRRSQSVEDQPAQVAIVQREAFEKPFAGTALISIEEEINVVRDHSEIDVVDCSKRKSKVEQTEDEESAPSFISGAFAAMGLIAGVGGHPVSSTNPTEHREFLFERPEYKKADDYISIQVDGFEELSFVLVTHAGRFLYQLSPKQRGRFYYIVVEIVIKQGQKRVTIRAPLQVKNNLDIPIDLLESGARLVKSVDLTEQNDRKIDTIGPGEVVNVPLFSAHNGNLFIQPTAAGFKKSKVSVSWKDFTDNNRTTILSCLPEETGPKYTCNVKVICEKDSLNTFPSKVAPHHVLQLHSAMSFWNFLPCIVMLQLEEVDVEDMIINPGKHCHVTCITSNKTSTFTLQVLDYMGTKWCGSFKVGGDRQRDAEIEMEPELPVNNKLLIKLDYLDRGCLVVNFYCPYWIVNRTNLSIRYKPTRISTETYTQSASSVEPLLFDSSSKTKKIMLKLHGCDWSNSFSLDAVGSNGQLVCKETKTPRQYEVSVAIELSHNRLTKIITILPKFVIINKTEHELSIFEMDQERNLWILIKENECVPFWPQTKSNALLVRINNSVLTSKVLRIDSLFPTIFRVGDSTLLEVNSEISESSTTIIFSPASSTNLPKVENLCEDIAIQLVQKDCGSTTVVAPLTSIVYCWDEPSKDLTLLWQPENSHVQPIKVPVNKDGFGKVNLGKNRRRKKKTSFSMFSCGCMGQRSRSVISMTTQANEPCVMPNNQRTTCELTGNKTIHWVSFLDGCQRILLFTDDPLCAKEARKHCEGEAVSLELFLSLDGVRLSVVNQEPSEIVYLGISSATSIWEVEKSPGKWKILNVETSSLLEEAWRNDIRKHRLERDVEVDLESMMMTKPYRGALNRRYEPGLWIHYCSSVNYESFSAKVHRVQIDNQIFGTLFPCALYPSPLPVSISQRYGFKPFFEISAIYRNNARHNLLHLRYFKVLVQEMNVKLEKDFLLAIYKLVYGDSAESGDDQEVQFREHLRSISLSLEDTLTESGSFDTTRLFLEYFHLSPLKVNLSISLESNLYQSEKQHDSDLFQILVNSVGSPLTEVNDVQIKLACFERCGLFVTQGSLVCRARKHYTWQALRQFHAIVLGLDVLGNPYGLLTDLREGVKDLFYEPYQGIVLGPQEFATGIVRGVKSLLGHAIGGTAGAMSRITGTFGQAFASLSFDQDYRMKRRLRMGNGPTGIQDGVTMGGKSFLMGLVFGVSGVVTKPIQGARAEGVEGFFKGFGKGILGLVTRPTVGVFDMVSTTLDGIRRSAEQEGEDIFVRMRMPRFSPPDAPLQPYVEYQANGNGILKSLPRITEIIDDVYVDHIPLPKESHSSIALFTNMRIMVVYQNVFWSEWKISLNIPYKDIVDNVRLAEGAIRIQRKNDQTEEIESDDQSTLQIVHKKLEEQLYHYRVRN